MTDDSLSSRSLSEGSDGAPPADPLPASLDAIEQGLRDATSIVERLELLGHVLTVLLAPDQEAQDGTSYHATVMERLQMLGQDLTALEAHLATRPSSSATAPPAQGEDGSDAACLPDGGPGGAQETGEGQDLQPVDHARAGSREVRGA